MKSRKSRPSREELCLMHSSQILKKLCGLHLVFAILNSLCNFWRIPAAWSWILSREVCLEFMCKMASLIIQKTVNSIPFDIRWGAKWIKRDLWDTWRLREVQTHQFSLKKWHSSCWSTLQLYMYIMWAEIICIHLNFAKIIIIIISSSFHFT